MPFDSQAMEADFYAENVKLLEKEFNTRVIIQNETDSEDPKAKQSLPGKPAILLN